jgi:hypothetical protein
VRLTRHPSRLLLVGLAVAATLPACGDGGDSEAGLVAGGGAPLVTAPADSQVALGAGDPLAPVGPPVTESPAAATAPVAGTTGTTPSKVVPPPPPTTARPPVPLPADPAAVVLELSYGGGYPLWSRPRTQPVQLHAGGRLVYPELRTASSSAYRRLLVSQVSVAEVRAAVAAAEDAGATSPPSDLGHDPRLADGPSLLIKVDRPGLASTLVVRDAIDATSTAPNLTPDQQARRRLALELYKRLSAGTPRPGTHLEAHVELVAYSPPPSQAATTTTITSDLRTWPGAPLQVGTHPRCFVLPFAELERRVPGWSTSTSKTRWQSGPERLQIDFYDATATKEGCGPPPS